VRKLRAHVFFQHRQAIGTEPAQVLVERVHEDGERQVALELGSRAGKDEAPVLVSGMRALGEKTGLANPGLSDEGDGGGAPLIDLAQHPLERVELLGAADELVG
jgi:hypothetical protein